MFNRKFSYRNRYSTWMRNYLKLSRVYFLSAVTVTWFGFTSVANNWRTKRSKNVSMSWEFVSERWSWIVYMLWVLFVPCSACGWGTVTGTSELRTADRGVTCQRNVIQSWKRNFRIKVTIWSQHRTCNVVTEVQTGNFGVESRYGQDISCFTFTFMLPCCIVTDFFLNNQPDALIIPILFCYKNPHVSGIFSAHHQEFSTVHSELVSFMQVSDDRFQAESGWNCSSILNLNTET
jgi:hypothetical protein